MFHPIAVEKKNLSAPPLDFSFQRWFIVPNLVSLLDRVGANKYDNYIIRVNENIMNLFCWYKTCNVVKLIYMMFSCLICV